MVFSDSRTFWYGSVVFSGPGNDKLPGKVRSNETGFRPMKMPESFLSRMILACLPFLLYLGEQIDTWRVAGFIVVVYWLMLAAFWFSNRLFPAGAGAQVFLFALALLAQFFWQSAALPPFWILSVFFLFPIDFLRDRKEKRDSKVDLKKFSQYFFERAMTGVGFFIFVVVLEMIMGAVRSPEHTVIEHRPAFAFFLLFLAAFLWKNQPERNASNVSGAPRPMGSRTGEDMTNVGGAGKGKANL